MCRSRFFITAKLALFAVLIYSNPAWTQDRLTNVSYDLSRELFEALNPLFVAKWMSEAGREAEIVQSHGSSSQQARAILDGQAADVVTFNQETDIEILVGASFVAADWREKFPNGASPYYSFPAFLVRAGNPKNIHDWSDLARDDVIPIFPNPKSSGNGRYTYLTAYAYGLAQSGNNTEKTEQFVRKIMSSVPKFEFGGRAATQSFTERGIGDVLVTFEAETGAISQKYAEHGFIRITPSISLLAAFPVAVVSANTERSGTTDVATAYLTWLYSPEAQEVLALNHYRVRDEKVAAKYAKEFPSIRLLTVDQVFGGWDNIQMYHLVSGGILDKLLADN
jgi:sulfate transport system substrate-binding protein